MFIKPESSVSETPKLSKLQFCGGAEGLIAETVCQLVSVATKTPENFLLIRSRMEVLHVHVLATNETVTLETAERPSLLCLDRVLRQGPPETGPWHPSVQNAAADV